MVFINCSTIEDINISKFLKLTTIAYEMPSLVCLSYPVRPLFKSPTSSFIVVMNLLHIYLTHYVDKVILHYLIQRHSFHLCYIIEQMEQMYCLRCTNAKVVTKRYTRK
jgi:hypothetical protein